jgi:hypothetical protein
VTSSLTTGPGGGSAAGAGRGEGTGSAASTGRGEGTGSAASKGCGEGTGSAASTVRRECTGTVPNVQQWLVPSQIRCALGNLARASLSFMQAGEPLASDGPIMMATTRMGMMRTVIAKTTSALRSGSLCCAEKKNPGHLGPGPIHTPVFGRVV